VASRRPAHRFPRLRFFDDRGLRLKEPYATFEVAVYSHLCRVGLRRLNDLYRSGEALPTDEDLMVMLLDHAEPQLQKQLGSPIPWRRDPSSGIVAPSRGYYRETLDRATASAAQFCLQVFDPEYVVERARAGGRASKRRPVFTPDLLVGIEHLSSAAQADALGCSLATIKKLRKLERDVRAAWTVVGPGAPVWPPSLLRAETVGTPEWYEALDDHGGLFVP
jgi:hypothetical protein